jgi:hypothetical protein
LDQLIQHQQCSDEWVNDWEWKLLIELKKGKSKLEFDQILNTKGGFVSGIKMVPVLNQVANTSVEIKSMVKDMSI